MLTENDIAAALRRPLSPEEKTYFEPLVGLAVAAFEEAAGIKFGSGTATNRLISYSGDLYISQPGVVKVESVKQGDTPRNFRWSVHQPNLIETSIPFGETAWVSYEYDFMPPVLVKGRIAELVARVLLVPDEVRGGLASIHQTASPYGETLSYAGWAQGGQTLLSPEDKRVARSLAFKKPANVVVMRP